MVEKNGKLYCDFCGKRIEKLTQEEALNDLMPHGWTEWQTAQAHSCMDCPNKYHSYETYYGHRIKRGHPGKRWVKSPIDGKECYTIAELREPDEEEKKEG